VLLIVLPLIGYDYVRSDLQERQEWSGTVIRVYSQRSFPGSRSFEHYWDVRTVAGEVRSPRIRPKSLWSHGRVGDQVVKRAGDFNPMTIGRR